MKTLSHRLIAAAVLLSASGTAWYLIRQPLSHPSSDSGKQSSQTALEHPKKQGLNSPAPRVRDGKPSFEELQFTAKARPTLETSLLNLDLSRPPSEQELIMAGQLGDPLSPTSTADLAKIKDPVKRAWQEQDNLTFGRAIQTWNEHRYDEAVALFTAHAASSPESPWAAESKLHIGCAAQYRGQYDVCYEQFGSIQDSTPKGSDMYQKAMLRVANIQTMQGQFDEAAQTYLEAMKTETSPKRRTYASSWLPMLAHYKGKQTALRDCVQKSLKEICSVMGLPESARRLEEVKAPRDDGFTAAQVLELCDESGLAGKALRVRDKKWQALEFPFLAHYKDEHFVAVLAAVAEDRLWVYDSRVGFQREMPEKSFLNQWSGFAISLNGVAGDARTGAMIASVSDAELNEVIGGCCGIMALAGRNGGPGENSPCGSGATQAPAPQTPTINGAAKPANPTTSKGSPTWWVNPVTSNVVVRDTPMWWESPYGLDVNFVFNYNSLDTLNAIRPVGPKWVMNYGSYMMEDPSGKVILIAGNGNHWDFNPISGGGYTPPSDFPCTLTKTGTYEFTVTHLETDTIYYYGRPAGVSTSASLCTSITDRWGVTITLGHNANGSVSSVTHSIGGTWSLIYNAAGRLDRINDPFGRTCWFMYDGDNALREIRDMGGLRYAFRYSTTSNTSSGQYVTTMDIPPSTRPGGKVTTTPSNQVLLTEITFAPEAAGQAEQPNRTWYPLQYRFATQPPDSNSNGMWENFTVNVTEISGGTKSVSYVGSTSPFGRYRTAAQQAANHNGTTYTYTVAGGLGHVQTITYPAGGTASYTNFNSAMVPLIMTRRDGVVVTQTVNGMEKPLTVNDGPGRTTTYLYESNGIDLKKITGPDSAVIAEVNTYNSQRLPTEITRRDGTKVIMTYNAQGQPETRTLKDNTGATIQVVTNTYNTGKRLASVDVDGRTVGSLTYDSIGRVQTTTDENNLTTTYEYDDLNRVKKVTYHDTTYEEAAYHPISGMIAWSRDRDGQRTLFFYDKRGYLIAANAPGQRFYYWGYNNDGQMTLLIDPKGNKTVWEYDIEGRLLKNTLQDTAVEQYAWNTKSQMFQHTSPRGLKTILGYDTQGRMNTTTYQTSTGATAFPTESVTYDVLDRVQTNTDGEGTTTYAFDTLARLGSVDGPYANDTVSYTYDALSRLDTLTTPGSVTQSFHYDSDERLDTWTDVFGSGSIAYSGRTQRVTGVSRAGGLLSTSFAYTAASDLFKLAQIKHETGSSVISQFDYTWNARQDMQTWQRKLGSTADRETKYDLGHDAAHQLESATLKQVSNSAVISDQRWGFDSIGNRTSEHDLLSNVSAEYSHNTTNQLVNKKTYSSGQKPWVKGSLDEAGHVNLGAGPVAVKGDNSFEAQSPARTTTITAKDSAGNTTTETWQLNSGSGATPDATFTYTHDSEGNLMGDGTSSFEWDLRNRLTAIVTGTHRTEFTYDGSDRRVRVVEKESGSVTSDLRYIYQGLNLLEERASNNSTVLRRFYSGGHVDVANGGTRYAYTTDHLGSIREVMQLDGTSGNPTTATLAARYDYDLWGKRTVLDGGSTAETLVMHGYTGHIRHPWSGLWLAPYRAYNSGLGRWISRDPIAEDGGINLYAYVENDALHLTDPLGLASMWDDVMPYLPDWMVDGLASPRLGVAADAMAGAADVISLGLGSWLRGKAAEKGLIDPCAIDENSPAYDFGGMAAAMYGAARALAGDLGNARPRIPGACFVAGTLIATAHGLIPIEDLRVGDRVLTPSGESSTEVDPETWSQITLMMPNPECESDMLDLVLLRSPEWMTSTGCEVGAQLWLELEEMGLFGWSEVKSIDVCPPIKSGQGRVVLATITHSNTFVMELKLTGQPETLKPTNRHCLFSVDQNAWVPAAQLKEGEWLQTLAGKVQIEFIVSLSGLHRVYNLEVETDHNYIVGHAFVLSHNAKPGVPSCSAPKPEFKKPKRGSGKEKASDAPSWAKGDRPYVGERGEDFANRLMNAKYGPGNWKRGAGTEHNKIQKWGDRNFE